MAVTTTEYKTIDAPVQWTEIALIALPAGVVGGFTGWKLSNERKLLSAVIGFVVLGGLGVLFAYKNKKQINIYQSPTGTTSGIK